MTVPERLSALRKCMEEKNIDVYVVPTADFHQSEYVGEHFKARKFITGFSGSAGTAVITKTEARLWTDGRYFIQATAQLEGTTVELMKMGEPGVPELNAYIEEVLKEGETLGFDGRVVSVGEGEGYAAIARKKNAKVNYQVDLIDEIWKDRPVLSEEPAFDLDVKYAGETVAGKLARIREEMKEAGTNVHVVSTIDDICWTLNIRGNDVPCNPIVLSYAVVTMDQFYLFINEKTLDEEVKAYLTGLGVTLKPYNDIYEMIKTLKNVKVLLETGKTNYAIVNNLDSTCKIVDKMNPTALAKSIKNPVEIENEKKAHIKDGVAMTKFIYWLKKNIGKIPMTEISVSDYLEQLRREQEGNLGLSFDTISAYQANAAMCHYSATPESDTQLKPEGLYLVDSGGQYYEGTTDITRTVALGPITDEEREHFTLVAMSMLRLGHVKFLYGCRGLSLDYVAREPLWSRGLNYDHGTGHGVGYLLNVHERPNGIRFKMVPERMDNAVLEAGMICSDEPGIYIEGSHGIRTENLILCVKDEKNQYGQFMKFEFLTFVPVDKDAVVKELMTERDIALLNAYHKEVFEKISPYMDDQEKEWLRKATAPI